MSRFSPNARIDPAAGLTKPLRTLKNVVLPAPFGPIRPQVPPGKTTLMSSIGVTPGEADGQALDLDHDGFPRAARRRRADGAVRAGRGSSMSFGICSTRPPGAVSSTCRRPTPKMISRKLGSMPHWAWKMNGTSWLKHAGDDGAPEARDAADQRRREQRQRVLRLEPERASAAPTCAASRQPATPVMNDASANAHSL